MLGLGFILAGLLLISAAGIVDLRRYAERDSDPLPSPEREEDQEDRLPIG